MSTLGLDGAPQRDENIFKRLFWPGDQPYDVDSLGQQGLWVCIIVAVISAIICFATGHPVMGLLTLAFYWFGGMGVRENSVAAAVVLACAYLFSIFLGALTMHMPGLLDIAIAAVLLANIRGTYIAAKWKRAGDPEMFPQRMNDTFTDKLIDQWPARFWPVGKYVFFALAVFYGVLLIVGAAAVLYQQAVLRHNTHT